jgi:hypothetical protein
MRRYPVFSIGPVFAGLLALGCAGNAKQAPRLQRSPDLAHTCSTAWSGVKGRSVQATLAPKQGGYRRIDDAERRLLASRIAERSMASMGAIEAETFNAIGAALHDLGPELRRCMTDATGDTQYTVALELIGTRGSHALVDRVTVKRISAVNADGTVVEVETAAEPCIAGILTRLELPPGGGPATMAALLRYTDCSP